jgi:indole-3-glycerol phosphate synthase
MNKPIFIAEIKTQSPFGFKSTKTFGELMECAITNGDWVSVHTNALWGGDFDAISFVRRNTNKPILAKGIHATNDDIERAIDHGADYVLVVDRYAFGFAKQRQIIYERNHPSFAFGESKCGGLSAMVNRLRDIDREDTPHKYLVNARDLSTGLPKKFEGLLNNSYQKELDAYLNAKVWVCQASGIRYPYDVNPNVDAFIVGEHLVSFVNYPKDGMYRK